MAPPKTFQPNESAELFQRVRNGVRAAKKVRNNWDQKPGADLAAAVQRLLTWADAAEKALKRIEAG